jgi:predicted dinucleotide-binding enzyme
LGVCGRARKRLPCPRVRVRARSQFVIDAMNPIGKAFALEYQDGMTSLGEEFAKQLPAAHVYKAFNRCAARATPRLRAATCTSPPPPPLRGSIGVAHMADTFIDGTRLQMLWAGPAAADQPAGAAAVTRVIEGVGFAPVYVGPIRASRNLESICE